MTTKRADLTGGQLLALGDEHQRGLHHTALLDCTRCVLERLGQSLGAPIEAEAPSARRISERRGYPDDGDRITSSG